MPVAELAVGVVFFLLALGAFVLTQVNGGVALVWPATAAAAAILIRLPRVRWLSAGVVLFAAGVAANFGVADRAWPVSVQLSGLNLAEIGLTAWIFRSVVHFPFPRIDVEQAALMTAGYGIAIPGLFAIFGAALLSGNFDLTVTRETLQWWAAHIVGGCLVGPPIILWSWKSLQRLASRRFLAENLATLPLILIGCCVAVRYVQFSFVVIAMLLMIAAFRVGGFGASLLSLFSGVTILALWLLGVRPAGVGGATALTSLAGLPVIALLATLLPPIAVGLGTDARRAAVRRLRSSEQRLREAMDHSPIGMLIADLDGRWGYTNLALQKMLGYSAEELRAFPPGGPSEPEEWSASLARCSPLLTGEAGNYDVERRFRHKDGHWVWTHVAVSLARDEQGAPLYLIAQIESLEERRHAEEKLAEERERLKITLGSITDAVITTDGGTRITYVNAAGERLLGQGLRDLEQRRLDEVIALTEPHGSKTAPSLVAKSLVHSRAFRRDSACVLHRADGSACYVRDLVSPILDARGQVNGLVVVLQDASADVEREQDLSHRASHDILTNLANRFEFQRRLARAFERAKHLGEPAALLTIDLDRFKAVNDSGGHAAGDALLCRVADALRLAVRRSDVVARLGGDEFAVILANCPEARALTVGQKIVLALNALELDWEGSTYSIGASVGLAVLERELRSEADWLGASDQACYRAKQAGRGQLCTAARLAEPAAQSRR